MITFRDLERKVNEFLDSKPARIEGTYNSDHSRYSFYFHVDRQPLPYLSLITGDCLNNLNASIDHLIYELTLKHVGHLSKTGFPICDTLNDFKAEQGLS